MLRSGDDVLAVITDPTEFNSSPGAVEEAIRNIDGYPALFEKAFGTKDVTAERIAKERSLNLSEHLFLLIQNLIGI
ncbi:MAG: hypothetical protein R2759_12800 [Bacteroidales bacterium]